MGVICLFLSISLNVVTYLPYVDYYINLFAAKQREFFSEQSSNSEVIEAVVNKTMTMDGSEYYNRYEFSDPYHDIKNYFIKMLNNKPESIEKSFSFSLAYCYAGLSYYAMKHGEPELMQYLISIADKYANQEYNALRFKVTDINQAPIGILYINLYRMTNNVKYLNVAKAIAHQIYDLRVNGNIIPYFHNMDLYFVDGVGMYVPFLMEFHQETNDPIAKIIAIDNFKNVYNRCVDKESGMPHHGYDPYTGIKMGSANWGRGIGWYMLAAAYIPEFNDEKLNKSITKLAYTQFPGDPWSKFDSSTALMFELYKQSKYPNRKFDINIIKPYITIDGMITQCSGDTRGYNDYSHQFGGSELCQGIFLMLVSKFNH